MMNCNRLRHTLKAVVVTTAAGFVALTGCITSDDTLGSEFLPNNQEMTSGTLRMANAERFFSTRLYQTDSIKSSNLGYGYFGVQHNDTTGRTAAGFMSQFASYYKLDSAFFGYRPIFDSAQIILSISSYGRDTISPQLFNVYEITSHDYITDGDSTFYMNFDPTKFVSPTPLFTFTFPNGTTTGPATKKVTMAPTAEGREFVNRLMISDGTKLYQEGVGYSIYQSDTEFIKVFKGLFITPANQSAVPNSKGTIFGTTLASSGFSIYCRNRVESDPTLINDTIAALYYFDHKDFENRNQSINIISHDYTGSMVDLSQAVESNADRADNRNIIVSGMGGVISELTFTQEFFLGIEKALEKANTEQQQNFGTLAINRALLTIYFTGSDYDWTKINPGVVTPQMNASLPRLGSYSNYKKLEAITDYNYFSEKNYQTSLSYNGYINRSQGCYTLDISAHIQELWNRYLAAKTDAGTGSVDLSKIENRSIFIGPEAYSLYTPDFALVQGMNIEGNNAPVKLDLTYTLIKK